jgi:Protein of unknown function (DUF2867)
MVRNVHERLIPVAAERLAPLIDRAGGPDDVAWPAPEWPAMVLDRPVSVGARGGHGPIRYHVTAYEPGRRVEFAFHPAAGLAGTHALSVEPVGPETTLVRHVVEGSLRGSARVRWPLVIRWLHDAVLEDLLDRAEAAAGTGPARPARWSPWVRLLRRAMPRAREVPVPATALLAGALPGVDWSDAHAVDCGPDAPADPQEWADALFRDAPRWVVAALALRDALVGLVGIDRSAPSAFATLARTADEVLLGTDERHLDFRASVLREPRRVVLSTVVQLHDARGRAYFAIVRRVHPMIVRAMLDRAASRLSNPVVRPSATMGA